MAMLHLRNHLGLTLAALAVTACSGDPQVAIEEGGVAEARMSAVSPMVPGDTSGSKTTLSELGDAFLPDFSYAGYGFGLEAIPDFAGATVVAAVDHGVVANDGKDDSQALEAALEAARGVPGRVVLELPPGRVQLSAILSIDRSDFVLRGAGSGQGGTDLFMPRPLALVDTDGKFDEIRDYLVRFDKIQKDPDQNVFWPFSEYSWTGGFLWVGADGHRAGKYLTELDSPDTVLADAIAGTRGQQTVRVSNTDTLEVGDDVEIVWFNREGEDGPLLAEMYGDYDADSDFKVGSHHWTFPERGLVRQKTVITAVDAGGITIADTLLHNITGDVPAYVVDWNPLTNVGIEDLRITFPDGDSFGHHLEQGYNGIYFTGTRDGWVRDVAITDADSGILSYSSANLTFDNISTHGRRVAHYSVHAGSVHNVLVSDLEVHNRVRHALSLNTKSTRTVFLRSEVHQSPTFDQHAGSNHQNLFDTTVFHIDAVPSEASPSTEPGVPVYPIWDGSGAGYWQPGHGRYNTTYNLEVRARSGVARGETLRLQGLAEGPDARLIGLWGNRDLAVDYFPEPLVAGLNTRPDPPSLYEYQLSARRAED